MSGEGSGAAVAAVPGRTSRRAAIVVVTHVLAFALFAGLAAFVWLPTGGDASIWSPAISPFEIAAAWLVAGGLFAWWRFGATRALLIADVAATVVASVAALVVVFLPVIVLAATMLLVGLRQARGLSRMTDRGRSRRLRRSEAVAIVVLVAGVVTGWATSLANAIGEAGPFVEYGVRYVMTDAALAAAILLWLDDRPGVLAGSGGASMIFTAQTYEAVVTYGGSMPAEVFLFFGLTAATAVGALYLAAPAIWSRDSQGEVTSLAIAGVTLAALVLQPLLVPVPIVLAALLPLERRRVPDDPPPAPPPAPRPAAPSG